MFDLEAKSWAQTIFGKCALGDQRRTKRLVDYAAREAASGARSTARACAGQAAAMEGAYRLLRNEAVDPGSIAEGGFQATVEFAREHNVLLAIEDSTTLGFEHSAAGGLGDLGGPDRSNRRGFWVHSVLLVDGETGRTVGLVEQHRWLRDPEERRGTHARRKPTDAKESEKWQLASESTAARMGDRMEHVISVCDREADIYEYLAYKSAAGQRFIVRSCNDRVTKKLGTVWSEVKSSKRLGLRQVIIEQRGGKHRRPKREVKLTVRAKKVVVRAPKYLGKKADPKSLTMWAVHAVEEHPPVGVNPLEWLLLTSEPCTDFESADRVLGYYGLRWRIEDFHKAWKSGCGVEDRRMQTAGNLERIVVILAFLAVRTLQLNEQAAKDPEGSCETIVTEDEWQCLWVVSEKSQPPKKAPSALWARNAIARLGGWFDTKRTGRVGALTMARGWIRLMDKLDGFLAAKKFYGQ